jgi:tetratricopeptide (TPR) repeat protein
MIYKTILAYVLLTLFASFTLKAADDATQLFNDANNLYKQGNFGDAAVMYKKIIDNGYESPQVYFNLGNSCYKMNKIADAILNYERAKRLTPSDDDIDFNLKVAGLQTVDKIQPLEKFFIYKWFEGTRDSMSSTGWGITAVILFWMTFILLTVMLFVWNIRMKKAFLGLAVISFLIVIFSVVFAVQKYGAEQARNSAIVYTPSVYVKSSPDQSGTDLFILHEGTKIHLLDAVGDWTKIRLEDGNVGWIQAGSFEVI